MKIILKKLRILQEVSNKGRNPKLGKGYLKAYRLNPYNPLSYITFILMIIMGVIMYGFIGIKKEMDLNKNPFVWD